MPAGCEAKVQFSGVGRRLVRIPNIAQARFRIPSLGGRQVRVNVGRHDTVAAILASLVAGGETGPWPGRRGRGWVAPQADTLTLVIQGQAIDPSLTFEQAQLFFHQDQLEVHIDDARAPPEAASDARPDVDDARHDAGAPIRADPVDSHANSHADLDGTFDADSSPHAGSAGDSASAGQQPSAAPARALDEEFICPARGGEVPEWYNHENHANARSIMARSIAKLLLARKTNARGGGLQLPREEPRDVWMRELLHTGARFEEPLFRGAQSFDEYRNMGTLEIRLQQVPAFDICVREESEQAGGALAGAADTDTNADETHAGPAPFAGTTPHAHIVSPIDEANATPATLHADIVAPPRGPGGADGVANAHAPPHAGAASEATAGTGSLDSRWQPRPRAASTRTSSEHTRKELTGLCPLCANSSAHLKYTHGDDVVNLIICADVATVAQFSKMGVNGLQPTLFRACQNCTKICKAALKAARAAHPSLGKLDEPPRPKSGNSASTPSCAVTLPEALRSGAGDPIVRYCCLPLSLSMSG